MRRTLVQIALPAILMIAASGCGGDEDNDSQPQAPSAEGRAPAALVGTYAMTLKSSDVPPDPPPELTDRAKHWTLEISNTGAPSEGPALTIINDELGTLGSSSIGVIDDRILLHDEECAVAAGPVESEYTWKLSGRSLRFTEISNGCEDEVALTLLTSGPWLKRP